MVNTISEKSFKVNLWIMKLFYLYPPESYSLSFRVQAWLFYLFLVLLIPTLTLVNLFCKNNFNENSLQINLVFVVQSFGYIIMYLPFLLNGKKLKTCIDFCNLSCLNNLKTNQKITITECVKSCQLNTSMYLVFCTGAVAVWGARPLALEGRHFPVDVWLPFKAEENVGVFYVTFLYIVTGMNNQKKV